MDTPNSLPQTASQTVGPYFRIGLIYGEPQNILVNEETIGQRIRLTGTVYDRDGAPVPDAILEIWQPDANGIFNHRADPRQAEADPHFRGFGRAENRDGGIYEFHTIKPGGRDGAAPYINVYVFARGMLIHALTRAYFDDEPGNETDAVLSGIDPDRRQTLIATRQDGAEPATYHLDIHLQGADETVFFAP